MLSGVREQRIRRRKIEPAEKQRQMQLGKSVLWSTERNSHISDVSVLENPRTQEVATAVYMSASSPRTDHNRAPITHYVINRIIALTVATRAAEDPWATNPKPSDFWHLYVIAFLWLNLSP